MPRVLTVDDSRAVRSIVNKSATEWGLEVDEAEDGVRGLEKLEECQYDVVLLDVTMPEMDGPTMLAKMRASGNKTPVLMLTSESKRSVVATAMKLGINDYILKPFKADELRAKIFKVIHAGVSLTEGPAFAHATAVDSSASDVAAAPGRRFCDILLVDDMENVHKKLRASLPAHVSLTACSCASEALTSAREHLYRLVLIDSVIPDVNSVALMNQIRALQPQASFLMLCLRSVDDVEKEARQEGFNGVLFKPFAAESISQLLFQYLDSQDLVVMEGNALTISPYSGRADRLEHYYNRLAKLAKDAIEKAAAACFDEVVVEAAHLPVQPGYAVRFAKALAEDADKLGMVVSFRGTSELQKTLASFKETAEIRFQSQ